MQVYRVFPLIVLLWSGAALRGIPPAQADSLVVPRLSLAQSAGNQIRLNGQTYPGSWYQSTQGNQVSVGISDGDLADDFGFYLQDSQVSEQQPVQWFSDKGIPLPAQFPANGAVRYLEITALQTRFGWQVQPQGNLLNITSGAAQVTSVKTGVQPEGRRIVLGLDRPAPWRFKSLTNSRSGKTDRELTISLDASITPAVLQGLNTKAGSGLTRLSVTPSGKQTLINAVFAGGLRPEVFMLADPPRLVIDIRPTPLRTRSISWAPGIQWREDVVRLGSQQFPLTWVELEPNRPELSLKPIWGGAPDQIVGIHSLSSTAVRSQAAVAINAGFFDGKRQTPLGAIRQNGEWISSPILNRGVVAWDQSGRLAMGRLKFTEALKTSSGQTLTVVALNSGYPQQGIARYTPDWGAAYTPISETETLVTVINDQVVSQAPGKGGSQFPIPRNGYILALRSVNAAASLTPGTQLSTQAAVTPNEFQAYPNILGAGPLLISNRQIVLNVAGESFQKAFEAAAAPRSAIAQTAEGKILLVTSHNRVGGAGPTLQEWARILQQMGSVNALNFDGGSSTSLVLGGRLIDRHPVTAARVQNALGVFYRLAPKF